MTGDDEWGDRLPPGWTIGIGWMSTRFWPGSGNPDVWHGDGIGLFDEIPESERGIQTTADPFLEEGPGPSDLASFDFYHDPAWERWMKDNLNGDNEFFLFVEDRDKVSYRHVKGRGDSPASTTCYAPAGLYLGVDKERDVTRELIRSLYIYAANKRGWSEPPPLPPYWDPPE